MNETRSGESWERMTQDFEHKDETHPYDPTADAVPKIEERSANGGEVTMPYAPDPEEEQAPVSPGRDNTWKFFPRAASPYDYGRGRYANKGRRRFDPWQHHARVTSIGATRKPGRKYSGQSLYLPIHIPKCSDGSPIVSGYRDVRWMILTGPPTEVGDPASCDRFALVPVSPHDTRGYVPTTVYKEIQESGRTRRERIENKAYLRTVAEYGFGLLAGIYDLAVENITINGKHRAAIIGRLTRTTTES